MHDRCEGREWLGRKRDRETTPHVVMISPNNQTPNRLRATPRESKEAMDMRKPRVPVMSDPTQKAVALLVLNPLTRSLMTSLPLPTKKTTETRRKELTALCIKTMECAAVRESTLMSLGPEQDHGHQRSCRLR